MMSRETFFGSANDHLSYPNGFVVQLQAASRTYLSKRCIRHSIPAYHIPRISSASSLGSLTREARYARAESALRVALSRCETEPSTLELQVRVLEKGLQAWNVRAGRGYERVQEAEAALAAARNQEGSIIARGSFSDLQREKWMGMKERDESLAMVEKIKELIKELNTEIMQGLKESPNSVTMPSAPQKASKSVDGILSCDTTSKKAAILFSGKLPMPYLERLPRSRRSVEPLRLPLHVTTHNTRRRSSTLHSEPGSSIMCSTPSTTQPPTPQPATPTDDFGAAFIHTPIPLKSVARYLPEKEETSRFHSHVKLPSYVGALLDELGEDRIGDKTLHIPEVLQPSNSSSPLISTSPPTTPLPNHKLRSRGSRGRLGRTFNNLTTVPALSRAGSQYSRSKENYARSTTLHEPFVDSTNALGKVPYASPNTTTTTGTTGSSSPVTSPMLDTLSQKHQIKSPGRIGNLMESVKRGVKKVSRRGE